MEIKEMLETDKLHIWHPYASATKPIPVYPVDRCEGVYMYLKTGEKLIDGMASWWAVIHGYNRPEINKAIEQQIKKTSHVMFGGITHEPAVRLTRKLLDILPSSLNRIFYADSGSVAVEIAMKMAIQYWYSNGKKQKKQFIALRNAYHGDTWHAMSVCDPDTGMHNIFSGALPQQFFITPPEIGFKADYEQSVAEAEKILSENHNKIAAFILEPVVQGAGGMRIYNPDFLKEVKKLCDKYEILFIADEIATGFGRTGRMFACDYANVVPDIMCIGKAITGGYMSFAATICTDMVAQTISNGNPGLFMHGPTYMANPLACAVAEASIGLLTSYDWRTKVKLIEYNLFNRLIELADCNKVADIRAIGAIGVIEMRENVDLATIQKEFVKNGVWVRPFGKLIYVMPPYVITTEQIEHLTSAIKNTIFKLYGKTVYSFV